MNFDTTKKKSRGKLNVKYDSGFVINVCATNTACNVVLIKKKYISLVSNKKPIATW